MNTFKRKGTIFAIFAGLLLAGCGTAEKRYQDLVQDTNDRIERAHKADSEADAKLAEALNTAAAQQPALVAAVASNVMMARALKGGAANVAFVVPQPPKSTAEEVRAWLGIIVPSLVQGYGMNRMAAVQIRQSDNDYLRFQAGQEGESSRVNSMANMAIGLRPTQPSVTTINTNTYGRDGITGGGTQQNDNSSNTSTTCTAGHGANGGNGGNGGGTTGAGAPGAAGGSGGNAC